MKKDEWCISFFQLYTINLEFMDKALQIVFTFFIFVMKVQNVFNWYSSKLKILFLFNVSSKMVKYFD